MPYPNEHALRLKPPGIFDPESFRRTAGGKLFGGKLTVPSTIGLIWAKLKGRSKPSDPPILQAMRFDKSKWTIANAKTWIKQNIKQAGLFEPAQTSTGKAADLTQQDIEQDILFGDYDAYDGAEVVKLAEMGEDTLSLADIEDDDPETEARHQYEQLMAAYNSGAADAEIVIDDIPKPEDTTTPYADKKVDEDKSTFDVPDVEVMAVGTWNNDIYKQKDLDLLAKNFPLLQTTVKPPLVLGHGDQTLLQASGLPAAGWVSKLKRVGDKLLADFSNVPRAVAAILKNKGYKRVSVEIYPNYQAPNGARYGLTLARVALLGAAIPAIKTLKDIEALYSGNLEHNETKEVVYMADEVKDEIIDEETEELKDKEQKPEKPTETAVPDTDKKTETADKPEVSNDPMLMTELRQMKVNYDELKSKLDSSSTIINVLQDQLAEQKAAAQLVYDEKFLDEMTAEGKLPPAVRSKALKLMGHLRTAQTPLKYTELVDGKEVEKESTVLDVFREMLTDLSVTIQMAETATGTESTKPGSKSSTFADEYKKDGYEVTGTDTVAEVDKRVKELREATPGKTDYDYYSEALLEVNRK